MTTPEFDAMPGLKAQDLRACDLCDKPLGDHPVPAIHFYRVTIEQFVLVPRAVQRRVGLEMMIGPQLAGAMGPDDDLAKRPAPARELVICAQCALTGDHSLPALLETPKGKDRP